MSTSSPPTSSTAASTTTTAITTTKAESTSSITTTSTMPASSSSSSTAATPQASGTGLFLVNGQRSFNMTTTTYYDENCRQRRNALPSYRQCCSSSGRCGNYGYSICNGECLLSSSPVDSGFFEHYQCSNLSLAFDNARLDPCTTFDDPPTRYFNASLAPFNLQRPAAAFMCNVGWLLNGNCSSTEGIFVDQNFVLSAAFCQKDSSDSVLYASRSYRYDEEAGWITFLPQPFVCDGRPHCGNTTGSGKIQYVCSCSQTADESAIAACEKTWTASLTAILIPTLLTFVVIVVCVAMNRRAREMLNRWFSGRAAKEAAEAYKQRKQVENDELQRRNEQADREAEVARQRALDIEARDRHRREEMAMQADEVALENERRRAQIEQERRAIGHDREDLELRRQEQEIEHNGRLRIGVQQLAHLERQTLALSDRRLQYDFDVGVDPTTRRAVNRSAMIMQSTGRSTSDADGVADMLNESANRRALPATQQPPRSSQDRSQEPAQ
ncbi:hypothetical protein DFJ73DRAFT_894187 [Zopfochytrium polystomum]|nr:hypothetical protein DFJ73DRAFT_894187 [Zopfochytrium polystomum]